MADKNITSMKYLVISAGTAFLSIFVIALAAMAIRETHASPTSSYHKIARTFGSVGLIGSLVVLIGVPISVVNTWPERLQLLSAMFLSTLVVAVSGMLLHQATDKSSKSTSYNNTVTGVSISTIVLCVIFLIISIVIFYRVVRDIFLLF